MTARRTAAHPETRALILHAAERLFAERGLAGARVDAIAAAAGVNKALIYYYFHSKEALFRAILETHLAEFSRQALAVLAGPARAQEKVLQFVSLHFDFIAQRPDYPRLFQRFMMARERRFLQLWRKYTLPVVARLQAVIEEGVRTGELVAADGIHTVLSLVALTVFYFAVAPTLKAAGVIADPYGEAELARRKRAVLALVRRGLFADGEAEGQ